MVYVDFVETKFRGMVMSHLLADTEMELDCFAERIGLQKKWKHNSSTRVHYDVCKSKKELAIENGAILLTPLTFRLKFKLWAKEAKALNTRKMLK